MSTRSRLAGFLAFTALTTSSISPSVAADSAIKIGNTAPYSGPASAHGTIARAEAAYFQMLNDQMEELGMNTEERVGLWGDLFGERGKRAAIF